MKKMFIMLVVIVFSIGLFACGSKPSISCNVSEIEIFENETFTLENKDILVSKNQQFSAKVLDENIIKFSDNKVIPLSVGNTKLRLFLVKNENVYTDINVCVKSGKIANTISVENTLIVINLGDDETISRRNRVIVNSDCTETPIVEYDNDIIDYNIETGLVTAKNIGTTRVDITFLKVKTSFDVQVLNSIYVSKLEMNDTEVFEDSEGKFDFVISPSNGNQYNFWSDSKLIDIFSDGRYKSYASCEAVVYYQYFDLKNNKSPIASFHVNVIPKINEMEVKILDEGIIVNNFVELKTYSMQLYLPEGYNSLNFVLSSNMTRISDWTYNIDHYQCEFYINESGNEILQVNFINTKNGASNVITKFFNINVEDSSAIKVGGKYNGAYLLNRESDNKFHLYLNGEYSAHDIYFIILLKGIECRDEIDVYRVYGKIEEKVDRMFVPDAVGEYIFAIYYNEILLENVTIVVSN